MGNLLLFARRHVGPSIGLSVGALWALYGLVSGVADLWTAGLSPLVWAAIGATIFFLSVVVLLVRWDSRAFPANGTVIDEPDDPKWMSKLERIEDRHFHNCEVELDDRHYTGCTFRNVTFKYGGGPYAFEHNDVGLHIILPTSAPLARFSSLLVTFGHIRSQLYDDTGPISLEEIDKKHRTTRKESSS
jgi:hypothetical protein